MFTVGFASRRPRIVLSPVRNLPELNDIEHRTTKVVHPRTNGFVVASIERCWMHSSGPHCPHLQ
jgi:hypothetical protein